MNINKSPFFQRAKCALCGKSVLGNVYDNPELVDGWEVPKGVSL